MLENESMEGNDMLTEDEYEALALDGLVNAGLTEDQARASLAGRWPTNAAGALSECRGRGIGLDEGALTAFLLLKFRRPTFDDGTPIVADSVTWPRYLVNELIDWAVSTGLARPAEPPVVTIPEMFTLLRSEDQAARIMGGALLSKTLGASLKQAGATLEQFERDLRPKLSATIGVAMAGGPDAAAALEALEAIAADPRALIDPPRRSHVSVANMLDGLRHDDVETRKAIIVALAQHTTHDGFPVRHVWDGRCVLAVYQGSSQGAEAAALTVAETADAISGACWRQEPTFHRLWVWEPTGWRLVRVRGVPELVRPGTGECEWRYTVAGEASRW